MATRTREPWEGGRERREEGSEREREDIELNFLYTSSITSGNIEEEEGGGGGGWGGGESLLVEVAKVFASIFVLLSPDPQLTLACSIIIYLKCS